MNAVPRVMVARAIGLECAHPIASVIHLKFSERLAAPTSHVVSESIS